jgi:hypothetical protein
MMEFLRWLENLGFSVWVRESGSLWSYPLVLFLHTVGLAFLVGPSVAIDLRLLGFARRMPVAPLETFYPIMWAGFWCNAISGVILVMQDATTKAVNPVLYLKLVFVAVAVADLIVMRRLFRDPDPDAAAATGSARRLAILSLVCWTGAIAAGRLIAYVSRT